MEGMSEKDVFEFSKHEAISLVEFKDDTVTIHAATDKPGIQKGVTDVAATIQETLDYCNHVIALRSDINLACNKVKLILNNKEIEV